MHGNRIIVGAAVLAALSLAVASPAEAANPTLHFSQAYFDSPGSDTGSNTSLNAEWVRVKNSSSTATYTLTSWTIRDASAHVYKFPTFHLKPGASVTLHTGKGTNTGSNLYWGRSGYIWNNTGDTATLKNSSGTTKDTCSWTSANDPSKTC